MKKAIVILLVLLTLGTAAFAGGFTLRGGFAYDNVTLKASDNDGTTWKTNSFGAEFGITYNFSDKFQIYADTGFGFFNKYKINDTERSTEGVDKAAFITSTDHAGAAFNINVNKNIDIQLGAGFAFEYARAVTTKKVSEKVSTSGEIGIYGIGVGLYANVDFKVSEKFALSLTAHPDFMFVSGYTASTSTTEVLSDTMVHELTDSMVTVGGAFSFKFNASVGAKFMF